MNESVNILRSALKTRWNSLNKYKNERENIRILLYASRSFPLSLLLHPVSIAANQHNHCI